MRFANSAISLNTNEHLIRLEITAYEGRKRAGYELITDLSKLDEMKQGIDIAAEMAQHAQPLNYQPTIPSFAESFSDESACDDRMARITNEDKLTYFNQAVTGLETDEIKLSGIFSNGVNVLAQATTRSEHTQYFKTSDAQVTAVLAHERLKWEVSAEQSAQKIGDLQSFRVKHDLAFLLKSLPARHAIADPAGQVRYHLRPGGDYYSDQLHEPDRFQRRFDEARLLISI